MKQIKKIVYRIRIKILKITNQLSYLLLKNNSLKINIVSSPKYKNKIKEDLMLQKYLLKQKVLCKIISWEDKNDASLCIIRSVWGYHKNLEVFKEFLKKNKTWNSTLMILDNIDKEKQYNLLQKNQIPVIETKFLEDISQLENLKEKQVLKPIISASGNDTYIIDENSHLEEYKHLKRVMVQPYISGIKQGELSIIVINHKIKYGIIRHPGVFTSYQKEEYLPLSSIPKEAFSIATKVIEINAYQEALFMRIDLVKDKEEYKVLEIELTDPDLFIESIPQKEEKKKIYQDFTEAILKKIDS